MAHSRPRTTLGFSGKVMTGIENSCKVVGSIRIWGCLMVDDDGGWRSRRFRRETFYALQRLARKLREAQRIAVRINNIHGIQDPETNEIVMVDWNTEIDRLATRAEGISQWGTYYRAFLHSSLWERLLDLKDDPVLLLAVIVSVAGTAISALQLANFIISVFVGVGHAAEISGLPSASDYVHYAVLAILILFQLASFYLLAKSDREDTRKFAADFLKVSLGIYVGAVQKTLG